MNSSEQPVDGSTPESFPGGSDLVHRFFGARIAERVSVLDWLIASLCGNHCIAFSNPGLCS